MFPKGLEKRYCADYLDCSATCKHGERCQFKHALFPGGFTQVDRDIMKTHVNETEGLVFKNNMMWVNQTSKVEIRCLQEDIYTYYQSVVYHSW